MQLRTLDQVRRRRPGFTLMEVLVVVAILVVLAGIGVMVFRYLDESKEKIAKVNLKNLETAVTAYKLSHGNYPDSLQELTQPTDGKAAYLETKSLIDPWNRQYVYDPSTTNPQSGMPLIYSQGANPGSSPQIRNWP